MFKGQNVTGTIAMTEQAMESNQKGTKLPWYKARVWTIFIVRDSTKAIGNTIRGEIEPTRPARVV